MPPNKTVTSEGRLVDESKFPGDVVITKGVWQKGKTIADVVDSLKAGDVILKGANAVDLVRKQAAILIGHPKAGTIGLALPAVAGRRVKLIIPVGLEKRVNGDLYVLAEKLNAPGASGYRLLPVPGEVFTELDALKVLTGAEAELIAAGGVCGAEGSCWLAISGNRVQVENAEKLVQSIAFEPSFEL
jgi:6-phosphogluconate dehydrogenase (decarboxylating)